MGVNSLPKTVTRQRRDCDLNPGGPSAPVSSTLTTRLPNHPLRLAVRRVKLHITYSEFRHRGLAPFLYIVNCCLYLARLCKPFVILDT